MLQDSKKQFQLFMLRLALNLMLLLLYGNLLPGTVASNTTNSHIYATSSVTPRNPNITILHEVHEEGFSTKKDKPLQPNILALKPIKKKPYATLEKPTNTGLEKKSKTGKNIDLHPVIFDYSLGDLEDLEHETFKKKDLSAEEKLLLRDASAEESSEQNEAGLSYTDEIKSLNLGSLQNSMNVQLDFVTTTTSERSNEVVSGISSENSNKIPDEITTNRSNKVADAMLVKPEVVSATDSLKSKKLLDLRATNAINSTSTSTTTTATTTSSTYAPDMSVSPHIYKILKNKSSKLHKYDDMPKGLNNHNSLQHYLTAEDSSSGRSSAAANATAASLQTANIFQIITNIYDHFYWQASDIRTRVSTGCGLEMQAYLTALHGNFNWAQKGKSKEI